MDRQGPQIGMIGTSRGPSSRDCVARFGRLPSVFRQTLETLFDGFGCRSTATLHMLHDAG
jgi:hypothetical protein